MDIKSKLSTLWVFVMINMIFADILSFMYPGFLGEVMSGSAGGVEITPGFLLLAAVILEIPILMIFLSRVLKDKVNRIVNIFAGVVTILFVMGGGSIYPHYIFFASVEVIALISIIWIAWKWPLRHIAQEQIAN